MAGDDRMSGIQVGQRLSRTKHIKRRDIVAFTALVYKRPLD
jgi:hypothetical protein